LTGPDHVTGWKDSEYAREGKTCNDCHTVHEASDRRLHLAADERGDVGEEACRLCHQPVFTEFKTSFHAVVIGKVGGGCEACHGPGRDHVEAARALARGEGGSMIAREPEQASCLLCHRAVPERHAREMPTYREKRPDCVVCHDVHVSRSDPLYAKPGDPAAIPEETVGSEACSACHLEGVSSASASVHASVVSSEGCERCHGPAGAHVKSGGRKRFIVSPEKQEPEKANALCLSCHDDRPEHARRFLEGPLHRQGLTCLTCHAAHGGREGQGRPLQSVQPVVGKATRVGSATCAICHEKPHPDILESPHATLVESGNSGCEQCHGPGSAHVLTGGSPERILSPARMPKERRAELCLACHGREPGRVSWGRGEHARAGLTCSTCHDPLASPENRSVKQEPDLCMVCHQDVAAQFRLPNRHPLGRGAVTCGSCHDPHAGKSRSLSLELRKERCSTCHRDKRGPFLFEHEADRQDGCVACHVPHGSANRRLLTHRRVSDLCIQCHVTPASHNLAGGSAFRNCLNCHGNIHGSYVDENFFR
jgi:DmsE family decaheme c-type cytochrome